ncbi:phenylalanine--tRNA ligase subunit beta [Candidatus Bipolaricaulota bacterium]|nr:phenylalanine--tRNA ligase subunit beta [Candidatus Bipolaricaulota bacterium]
MEISYRWLADFLDLEISEQAVEEYAELLTMAGAEVESVTYVNPPSELIVGEVRELSLHPDADNLFLAEVDVGDDRVSTITAAGNLHEGALVPVITAPGELPNGDRIDSRTFKGEKSEAMLCSKEELGLEEKSSGIWILDEFRFSPGADLMNELEYDDYVLDFEITSNRPDLLNVEGIARELSVLTGKTLNIPDPQFEPDRSAEVNVQIEDPSDTPRYSARTLSNVEITSSPPRLQHRLAKTGMRPKNNVVDATNYALAELGHPLHPFDLGRIKGKTIKIRRAKEKEKLTTLDGESRDLSQENLVIADDKDPIALAGIMGGQLTEVTSSTNNVLLEGACFDGARIRQSSGILGLTTDASKRFEKGMDPGSTERAINRATEILADQRSFEAGSEIVDKYPAPPKQKEIVLRKDRAESLIGVELKADEIERILNGLGIASTRESENSFSTSPPLTRVDLKREVDLIEEIARIHGYDKIPETPPESGKVNLHSSKEERVTGRAKTILTGLGFFEAISSGFSTGEELGDRDLVRLKNPMGDKRSKLRSEINSGLISHAERNFQEGIDSIRLFEIGKVFESSESTTKETSKLGLFLGGRRYEGVDQKESYNFWDLKGALEDFFESLSISDYRFDPGGPDYLHPGRKSRILIADEPIGFAGELHPDLTEGYDLPDRVYLGELNFVRIVKSVRFENNYEEIPKFPSSKRDLSLTVPEKIKESEIREVIVDRTRVERAYLYDLYQGEQIEEGKRSLTYEITFRDPEKTLSDEEVDEIVEEIRNELDRKGITLRE